MHRIRILLADDHTLVAHAVADSLRDEFDFVGIVANGYQLIESARTLRPDVILSDIAMPELGGLDALRMLRAEKNNVKIIFLTMHGDPPLAAEAFRAGALGFLRKDSASDELATAIREVFAGNIYLSARIAKETIELLSAPKQRHGAVPTARQRDVLRLIADGLSVKQIAAKLDLSPRTVETHKYEMMQNLHAQSTAELVRYAIRSGLVAV